MNSSERPPSGRRALQSRQTRHDIVRAATVLFLDRGYANTSIAAVARQANVALQTIYNSVGNKAQLLSAVIDDVAAGDQAMPVVDFLGQRLGATTTAGEVAVVLADWFAEVNPRLAPVYAVLDAAAGLDPEIAALRTARSLQRFERYGLTPALLRERDAAPRMLDDDALAALAYSIGSPSTHAFLVNDAGWTLPRYRQWVLDSLVKVFG